MEFNELSYKKKNIWEHITPEERNLVFDFSKKYIDALNYGKTERLFIEYVLNIAKKNGFSNIFDKERLSAGDKIFLLNRNKSLILAIIGKNDIENGILGIVSHIDSPRIDLKMQALYEDNNLCLLKTHYYGGIKKYQWTTVPLELVGCVYKKDGSVVNFRIGNKEEDPVFVITDLLIHLAKDQMDKKLSNAIEGEKMNILFGSIPYKEDSEKNNEKKIKEKIKYNLLKILYDKFNIVEEELISADISAVPAFEAKDTGLDSSFVIGYGQDDRISAWTSFEAINNIEHPENTIFIELLDREEIGSTGNTGAEANLLEYFITLILSLQGGKNIELKKYQILYNSTILSADVSAGLDPNYPEVMDKLNSPQLGYGITLMKYGGSRGKYYSVDASPELMGKLINFFNDNSIIWQTGELGKVDQGGGGTVASFFAKLGADVIDCGVPLFSMHAPLEVSSKADIYMTYKAFLTFLKSYNK